MYDRTPTLQQQMEHLGTFATSLNQCRLGSGSSEKTRTTTKASARKMDSKEGGAIGTAGMTKDDSLKF